MRKQNETGRVFNPLADHRVKLSEAGLGLAGCKPVLENWGGQGEHQLTKRDSNKCIATSRYEPAGCNEAAERRAYFMTDYFTWQWFNEYWILAADSARNLLNRLAAIPFHGVAHRGLQCVEVGGAAPTDVVMLLLCKLN